ncbi:MAG TPA: IS66 family transposase [Anaerolineales bacterium]
MLAVMSDTTLNLPNDIDALKAMVRNQAAALAEQEAALAHHNTTIEQLKEQVRLLLSQRFGRSSERLVSDGQLGLFNEAEAGVNDEEATAAESSETATVAVTAHRRQRGGRRPLPEHLEREDIVYELAASERVCPHDGSALEVIGEETSEQLDIVPASVRVLRHRRLKYACPCCQQHVRTATMPAQPIEKSQASPGLLAYVAVSKYADALPLYRQTQMFDRIGVALPRQTLSQWMIRSGELVQPLVNLLRDRLLDSPYVQMDETTVQVLKEPGKTAQSTSYLWVQRSGDADKPVVLFDYDPSRSGSVPQRLLGEFSGYLQTDGYDGYNAVVSANGITQLNCFAHARRRFTDALKAAGLDPNKLPDKPPDKARRTFKGLGFIRHLYAIEHRIREHPPDQRYAVRQAESVPVLKCLRAWLDDTLPKVLPKAPLGRALAYLDKYWMGLVRYCDDGRLAIDNNLCENAIRPFCVGRKNWLFSDTVQGARASANLYSLIETAKANGLEPYAYLRYVFTELPKATSVEQIEALLPYRLKEQNLDST